MKIIFLDIDGVLATSSTHFKFFDRYCLKRLKTIIEATNASIVLSSTWRKSRKIEDIRNLFIRNGDDYGCWVQNPEFFPAECIIGKTPILSIGDQERKNNGGSWGRGHEIEFWLEQAYKFRKDVESYLVLDDDSADLDTHKERHVQTDCHKGLLDNNIEESIRILNTPINARIAQ